MKVGVGFRFKAQPTRQNLVQRNGWAWYGLTACVSVRHRLNNGWLWNGTTRSVKGYWDFLVALRLFPERV
jgi:hypothetical protein